MAQSVMRIRSNSGTDTMASPRVSVPELLVERNSEIDTTVGAVCDRAQSLSFGKMRGHRPRLQKLWYQIHCYAPLVPMEIPSPELVAAGVNRFQTKLCG